MNRKLLAAALGVTFTGLAQAQTSVVLYGLADGNFRLDRTSIGTLKSIGSGGSAGSRWGLRGTENLGNGLKANVNLEQGFDLGDNSSAQGNVGGTTPNSPVSSSGGRIFSRTATVGLASAALGELRFGRAYTPFFLTWATIDPFGNGMVAGAQNIAIGQISRFDNAIYYDSPKFSGLQITGAYRLGESTTNSVASGSLKNGGNSGNIAINYANGPVLLGYSYLNTRNALDNNTTRSHTAGGVYDFKVVKLHALYFSTKDNATVDQQSYGLGVTVPFGAFTFLGLVGRIDNRYDRNNSTLKNNDATRFGVGATYAFSKRTDLYTSAAKVNNKGNAVYVNTDSSNAGLFTTTGVNANVPPGFDPWSFQVGLRHRF